MNITEFEMHLGDTKAWNEKIFPSVKDIIYRTLKGVQDTQLYDSKCRCFEVYGFDIMFDENMNPWVLEVNLSPACSEKRAPFLSKMLDDMAFDLVNWLERKILVSSMPEEYVPELNKSLRIKRNQYFKQKDFFDSHINLNNQEFYKENDMTNKWVRLNESIEEVGQYNLALKVDNVL